MDKHDALMTQGNEVTGQFFHCFFVVGKYAGNVIIRVVECHAGNRTFRHFFHFGVGHVAEKQSSRHIAGDAVFIKASVPTIDVMRDEKQIISLRIQIALSGVKDLRE